MGHAAPELWRGDRSAPSSIIARAARRSAQSSAEVRQAFTTKSERFSINGVARRAELGISAAP